MPTVLITGTSTGIGHVTTEVLAARGWRVFATMCDLTREDSLEGALENAALRYRVMICQLDVSDANSIHAAVASILAQTDAIDAVVHNAGVAVAGALEDLPSLIASTSTDKWRCRTFTPPGATPFPTRRVVRSAPPNVCYWHLADIATDSEHVRSWGVKRTSLVPALVSANDPKRTSISLRRMHWRPMRRLQRFPRTNSRWKLAMSQCRLVNPGVFPQKPHIQLGRRAALGFL